jgi:hypothetical protein
MPQVVQNRTNAVAAQNVHETVQNVHTSVENVHKTVENVHKCGSVKGRPPGE